ncbi:DUF4397 domain-containing protein [Shimazuella kribbensis]|uniref:DUF4397 domain-containing protein n=1 Tax=Shimazuella kribbensis TaxID=139808 RepID=UPI000414959B|nr:DUF4397 domain-containing protein [Shimazuella kribbensis]
MWRDELGKVTRYYFLTFHYHGRDQKKYEKYTGLYHHHLKKYAEEYEKSHTQEYSISVQERRAKVRLLHVAVTQSEQPIDVHIDGKFVATITYLTPNPSIHLSAGKHKITLYRKRQSNNPILHQEITVRSGNRYLVVAANKSDQSTDGIKIIRYEETDQVPANKAKIRFIHLSPNAPGLDVMDRQHHISFTDIIYKENTRYVVTEPGRANILVKVTGTDNGIASISFDMNAGHAYTLIAAGVANELYWLLLMDK